MRADLFVVLRPAGNSKAMLTTSGASDRFQPAVAHELYLTGFAKPRVPLIDKSIFPRCAVGSAVDVLTPRLLPDP